MSQVLFRYERVDPTTWAYLASLLSIAVYFKFSRLWSVRNIDLVALILLAAPLLLVRYGWDYGVVQEQAATVELIGYIWLFAVSGLFMLRLLLDATMVRRPLLEPNLSVGGLAFLGVSLFIFLMANVVQGVPAGAGLSASERAAHLRRMSADTNETNSLSTHGPGFPLLYLLPQISTQSLLGEEGNSETQVPDESLDGANRPSANDGTSARGSNDAPTSNPLKPARTIPYVHVVTARVMAILSQFAIVAGMLLVGMRHFDNIKTGVAAATLYLLLPYTAMWTGDVTHSLPAALLVWAVVLYRRPLLAGSMIGLAFGTIYYPVFLLPLWISFYWRRGLRRFFIGVFLMIGLLVAGLAFTASDMTMFGEHVQQMFGIRLPTRNGMNGAWQFWDPVYRYPILAAFVGLCLSLSLWPAQKNLGTLIAYSAAVMLGTQFWHAHSGGLALAWYLPLLLLTIFRPNLEDRLATAVVT
jgi:hypothetical protein